MIKTEQDFKDQVKKLHLRQWEFRRCSLCNAPLYYVFEGDKLFYDSNCDCVPYRTSDYRETSWKALSNHYNANIENKEYIAEIDKFFGFNGTTT